MLNTSSIHALSDIFLDYRQETIDSQGAMRLCHFLLSFPLKSHYTIDQLKNILNNIHFETSHYVHLANILNLDFEDFFTKNFCLDALVHQLVFEQTSQPGVIPVKYREHMFSSTTSLNSILNQFKNKKLKDHIFRRLQIPATYFDQHRPLSILAIRDALAHIANHSNGDELHLASIENCEKFMSSSFGQAIKNESSLQNLYEASFAASGLIEKSWNYQIQSSSKNGISILSEQTRTDLKLGSYTNEVTTACRLKFIESIGRFCGYENIQINECQQLSKSKIHFNIDFTNSKRFF